MENRNNRSSGSSKRGFAAMDKDKQREIAAKGGRASHGGRGSHTNKNNER